MPQVVIFDTAADTELAQCVTDNPLAAFTPALPLLWSPNGAFLATCMVCLRLYGATAVMFDVHTGVLQPQTHPAEWAAAANPMAWRPDGAACLLHIRHDAQCKLSWWAPWIGGKDARTCLLAPALTALMPRFSPDGSKFAVIAAQHSNATSTGASLPLNPPSPPAFLPPGAAVSAGPCD